MTFNMQNYAPLFKKTAGDQCLDWAGMHQNAIPALFGKAERHTGTSGDARGRALG